MKRTELGFVRSPDKRHAEIAVTRTQTHTTQKHTPMYAYTHTDKRERTHTDAHLPKLEIFKEDIPLYPPFFLRWLLAESDPAAALPSLHTVKYRACEWAPALLQIRSIRSLKVCSIRISAAEMRSILRCSQLSQLVVFGTLCFPTELPQANLPNLTELRVMSTICAPASFAFLASFPVLRAFHYQNWLSPQPLPSFQGLSQFVALRSFIIDPVRNPPLLDADVLEICSLPNLRELALPFPLTEQGFRHLSSLANLHTLKTYLAPGPTGSSAPPVHVHGSWLRHLRTLTELEKLETGLLVANSVQDALPVLAGLPSLSELKVWDKLSSNGLIALANSKSLRRVSHTVTHGWWEEKGAPADAVVEDLPAWRRATKRHRL